MSIKKLLSKSFLLMFIIPFVFTYLLLGLIFLMIYLFFDINIVSVLWLAIEPMRIEVLQGRPLPLVILFWVTVIMLMLSRTLLKSVLKRIGEPLDLLNRGAEKIQKGDFSARIEYGTHDEFEPIVKAFNDMANQLETNEASKKELIAGISHDLRSPLTSIKGFVEGLIDGIATTEEGRKEYLEIILQKTNDINNMVGQLFVYSKLDMGDYPTHPEVLTISEEIHDFIAASKKDYLDQGLTIEFIKMNDVQIYADPIYLRRIFSNLLSNSAKYKEEATGIVRIKCKRVIDVVELTFEDNGPGVPEEVLSRLFDVFYRTDRTRNNPGEGSGLGLSIVAKSIQRMGGKVRAENVDTGGLRVIVQLPIYKEMRVDEKDFDY